MSASRPVLAGAFDVLGAVRAAAGSAYLGEVVTRSDLPRTTVRRLLAQLESVGAVERVGARWRIGATVLHLGGALPVEPRLPMVARRPLIDLADTTRELAGISVAVSGASFVVDLVPAERPQAPFLSPGEFETAAAERLHVEAATFASRQAQRRGVAGDHRSVIDAGENIRGMSCVAVPVTLLSGEAAAVWSMVPGNRIAPSVVDATRRAASDLAAQLARRPGRPPRSSRGGGH